MKIIRFSHEALLTAPESIRGDEASLAWLSSLSDSGWRVLIDFRNWPNWIPGIRDVEQADQESPARGTKLRVNHGSSPANCSIDHWDPPRGLCFSVDVAGGEMAYGFTIQENPMDSELLVTLELERSIDGLTRPLAFFLQWRLQRLARRIVSNLTARMGTARS